MPEWVEADWPAPPGVRALTSTRNGGVSVGPYISLNLGDHVGDDPQAVRANRHRLHEALGLPAEPRWLTQVHGGEAVSADSAAPDCRADASYTERPGVVCAVLTADCLPVVLSRADGRAVAVAHAGWRGLAAGVIEAALARFDCAPGELLVWLGPAIGPAAFEVGEEVRAVFIGDTPAAAAAFTPAGRPGHWYADLFALARLRLQRAGVEQVFGGGLCTYSDAERFYSYRRDGQCGRMATLCWMTRP